MPLTSHRNSLMYRTGTTRPESPPPTGNVSVRRQKEGWLHVHADEFFRLLSLHERGEINLLEMPMTADDEGDEEDGQIDVSVCGDEPADVGETTDSH